MARYVLPNSLRRLWIWLIVWAFNSQATALVDIPAVSIPIVCSLKTSMSLCCLMKLHIWEWPFLAGSSRHIWAVFVFLFSVYNILQVYVTICGEISCLAEICALHVLSSFSCAALFWVWRLLILIDVKCNLMLRLNALYNSSSLLLQQRKCSK